MGPSEPHDEPSTKERVRSRHGTQPGLSIRQHFNDGIEVAALA